MYSIKTNKSGTRSIQVTDEHLKTIEKYQLLNGLVDSNGIIDEGVLEKLRLNIRSLIVSQNGSRELLDLCIDVVYHNNMKAPGLSGLIELYHKWLPIETNKTEDESEKQEQEQEHISF